MDDPLRLDHQVVSVEAGKVIVFANHRIGEELAKLPPATGTKGQLASSEPGKRGKGKKGGSGRSRKKQPDKSAPTLKESIGSRTRGTRLKKLGNTPKEPRMLRCTVGVWSGSRRDPPSSGRCGGFNPETGHEGGDTRVGVQGPVEGRALMVEKVEKHEWLQDLTEVGRAHQTRDGAVIPATGTLHDRPRQARRW
jgi:hypothetical protein